ncbi:hypothetical protein GCM10019059_30680 [Camelimonas fluminis]|nr:hypothetical protein GCM10019059_30680 [Camelimonas fluminis]
MARVVQPQQRFFGDRGVEPGDLAPGVQGAGQFTAYMVRVSGATSGARSTSAMNKAISLAGSA